VRAHHKPQRYGRRVRPGLSSRLYGVLRNAKAPSPFYKARKTTGGMFTPMMFNLPKWVVMDTRAEATDSTFVNIQGKPSGPELGDVDLILSNVHLHP
jgi:hypothetical protein